MATAAVTGTPDRLRIQVAEIGPQEYAVTAWAGSRAGDAQALEAALDGVSRREPVALLVDVRALTLLDQATVKAVASSMRRLRDAGVSVVLVADARHVNRVAGADGLDRFVPIRPTLASAIEAVRRRSA